MAVFNRQMDLMQQARASSTFNPMKLTVIIYDKYFDLSLFPQSIATYQKG